MSNYTPSEVVAIANDLSRDMHDDFQRWETLSHIYHGRFKELYPKEFRAGEIAKVANFIRRTWDMFARFVGKNPDKRVAPLSLSQKEQERADLLEKICFSYDHLWDIKRKMNVIAHYFVGFGAFAAGVMPDPTTRSPMLLVEDPRNVLPGPGWQSTSLSGSSPFFTSVNNSTQGGLVADAGAGTLEFCIIRKQLSGTALRRLYPHNEELTRYIADDFRALSKRHTVLQFYDDMHLISVLQEGGILLSSVEHRTGWCPWQFGTQFAIDAPAGSSMFEQQVGLNLAFMRLLDQKLGLGDAVTWPWIALTGFWDVDAEKRLLRASSTDAKVQTVSPPANFSSFQEMGLLRDLLRTLNMETEASQGEISGGGHVTGRGIIELSRPLTETIQSFFDDLSFYLPKLYTTALVQDVQNFGNETKVLAGRGRGETFLDEYTPAKNIGEKFGAVSVEFGPGIGGMEGHVQRLQSLGAEAVALRTVMEHDPNIRSVDDELRKVKIQKLEKLLFEGALQGEAAVPPEWLAQLIEVLEKGQDYRKWMIENPPTQSTATPANVPPLPPEVAAAASPEGIPAQDTIAAPPLAGLLAGA